MTPSNRSRPRPSPRLAHTTGFEAIGTPWEIDSREPLPAVVLGAVRQRTDEFDRAWSRFRGDSLVRRIAEAPGRHVLPAEAGELLGLYRELYEATAGAVSPLAGHALEALGYDSAYSLRPRTPRPAPAWEDAIAWDGEALTTLTRVLLDVGAAGKGLLVDLVSRVLLAHGVDDHVVDASGDILHVGVGSLRVGLEHPADPTRAIGVVELSGRALASSATTRRAWGDGLHHVIDVTTGLPTRGVVATWAVADTAALADGLATALFFRAAELEERYAFEWARMTTDGRVEHSAGFSGEIFR